MNANLAAAFVAATGELQAIGKDAVNPHFKNKYASLDTIIETVRPILATHGLAVTQSAKLTEDGKALVVETTLLHASGESLTSHCAVPITKFDAQGAGGALTYGRRYGLSALLCLATDDDDDGNAASRPAPARRANTTTAAPPAKAKAPSEDGPEYVGPAADRPMPFGATKGQPLKDHSQSALRRIKAWCIEKDDAKFGPLVKDITSVLADMALGQVEKKLDAEDAGLPF